MNLRTPTLLSAVIVFLSDCMALAVTIDLVPVGNPSNAPMKYLTAVMLVLWIHLQIGKYEITAGQYCEFLNSVAKEDPYGLYNVNMDMNTNEFGCNIKRYGTPGNYSYSVAIDWANRPVNCISWGDAAAIL